MGTYTKTCSKCRHPRDLTSFDADSTKSDGLYPSCKDCRRPVSASYHAANGDARRAAMREHYADNKEDWERYYWANRPRIMCRTARATARKKGLPFSITPADITIPECCPICGVTMTPGRKAISSSPSLDKYVPSLGYVPSNVWVICYRCNSRKSDFSGDELLAFAFRLIDAFKESQNV